MIWRFARKALQLHYLRLHARAYDVFKAPCSLSNLFWTECPKKRTPVSQSLSPSLSLGFVSISTSVSFFLAMFSSSFQLQNPNACVNVHEDGSWLLETHQTILFPKNRFHSMEWPVTFHGFSNQEARNRSQEKFFIIFQNAFQRSILRLLKSRNVESSL